jgi:hypothetical protein
VTPLAALDDAKFDIVLDLYDSGVPSAARKILDLRASLEEDTFRSHAKRALLSRPASPALKHIVGLLDFADVVQLLLELYVKSKVDAVALAKKILSSDPRFDVDLLEWLREKDVGNRSDDVVLIVFDILDAVSERDRLVLSVSRFMKHPHPKLRSKAALFIARRRPNLSWIRDLSSEFDSRVRANILESLLTVKEEFVLSLFREHVADEDNRTAGNAILGLYRFGDANSVPLIYAMAKDPRPEFRSTSAWVMGQTGDPQFSQTLAAQLSDESEIVRRQALNGLREIKKALKEVRDRNLLLLGVLKYQSGETGNSLAVTVCKTTGESVSRLAGDAFLLKAGVATVEGLQVQEYISASPLNAVFITCLPENSHSSNNGDQIPGADLEAAMKRCLDLRKPGDVLTAASLSYELQLKCQQGDTKSTAEGLRRALTGVDFSTANLHLIIVGASAATAIIQRVLELSLNPAPTLHVVAWTAEWQNAELKEKVERTGGFFRVVDKRSDLAQACFESYVALRHHYRLSWAAGGGDLELEIRSEAGSGLTRHRQITE